MNRVILLGIALILLVGCTSQGQNAQTNTQPTDSGTTQTGSNSQTGTQTGTTGTGSGSQTTPATPKTYTLADVSSHSSASDCWVIVHDKVYDITKFIASGQHKLPLDGFCGKDATVDFDTRPKGPGTPHPPQASENLNTFYVGDLAK